MSNKVEEMKRIVVDALKEELKKPSDHDEITSFAKGVEAGREMSLAVITGGLCNMSYKLKFKDGNDSDPVLFVKLTFGTPVAFPDVPCSPDRTSFEFKALEMFANATPYPESAIKPYLYIDVDGTEENMKIIVTQFSSKLEEQAGNLFIDGGVIDKAFATTIGKSLAALHNTEVTDPEFNEDMKEFFLSMLGMTEVIFAGYLDESAENPSRTALAGRAIGKSNLDEIIVSTTSHLLQDDCYVHGDCHMFNMLVASKLKAAMSEAAGEVTFVDWEFAHCGPAGKDIGWVQVFPIACALTHTINGDAESASSIVEFCESVWSVYEADLQLDGKNLSIEDVYRSAIASLGIMLQTYSALGVHLDHLPIADGNTDDLEKIKDSLGVLSLECYEIGYLNKYDGSSVGDLRKHFKDALQAELDLLTPAAQKSISKRRSTLRATRKRVSDAHSYFSMSTEVDIVREVEETVKRASIRASITSISDVSASEEDEEEDAFNMSDTDFFNPNDSEELGKFFGGNEDASFGSGSGSSGTPCSFLGSRMSARMSTRMSKRMSGFNNRMGGRMSMTPRISLAITDLKRKSIGEWDQMILDFEWDGEDSEEFDGEEGEMYGNY